MSHTEGRLVGGILPITINDVQKKYHCVGTLGTTNVVAITGEAEGDDEEVSVDDARRLVACWNAFDEVPQSHVETLSKSGGVIRLVAHREELRQERDELVKALRDMAEQIKRCDYTQARNDALAILARYPDRKS